MLVIHVQIKSNKNHLTTSLIIKFLRNFLCGPSGKTEGGGPIIYLSSSLLIFEAGILKSSLHDRLKQNSNF